MKKEGNYFTLEIVSSNYMKGDYYFEFSVSQFSI